MKKTKIITAVVFVLALALLAGETLAGPGRGGRGRGGGRPGWGRGITGGPRMGAQFQFPQQDDSWVQGPYCPWGQAPNQNIRGRQGRGPRGFSQGFQGPQGPYYPWSQGPNQNMQGRPGQVPRGFGQGFQRPQGPYCPWGRGPNQNIRGRQGRGGRMPAMPGRGGRGYQRGNIAPRRGWDMNNRPGQPGRGGFGRPGPGWQPQWPESQDKDQMNQPIPPRGRGWTPGGRPGWRKGWGQNWTPDWNLKPQAEKAPDTNTPEPPIVKDQPEQPQGE